MNTTTAVKRYPILSERLKRRADEIRQEMSEMSELIEYYEDHGRNTARLRLDLELLAVQARGLATLLT